MSIFIKPKNQFFTCPGRSVAHPYPARSCRQLRLFPLIPAVPGPNCNGTGRKNIRKMEAVFLPEFFRTGTVRFRVFPDTGKKPEALISCQISIGISQYPSGIDRKQEHIRPSTTHPRPFVAFHRGFLPISLDFTKISPSISLGFRWNFAEVSPGFHWDFTGISSGFHGEFHWDFTEDFTEISLGFREDFLGYLFN